MIGSFSGGPGAESAVAAFRQAATVTAASAERSGTAAVRIEHNGAFWAGTEIRWNGSDVSIARDLPSPLRPSGDRLRVVGGILYGPDPEVAGGWLSIGSPENIDPDSGTTPDEYLAAVREDVGGVTLRRFTDGVTGLTRAQRTDGSAIYRGTVAAGLVARETGFKEGRGNPGSPLRPRRSRRGRRSRVAARRCGVGRPRASSGEPPSRVAPRRRAGRTR